MQIKHLRKWLENLPAEYDEFDMVYREVDKILENGNFLVKDNSLTACDLDVEHNEAYFCNEITYKEMNGEE